MRPPTGNPITQGKHGAYNAVDYSSAPDPIIYAPENVVIHAYLLNAGDAGNNLQANGQNGRHGFCHLEESYAKPGQTILKGQPLGKMGYTGLTIPSGPQGRHLHWVLLRNGVYVYPPDFITETFGNYYDQYSKEELYQMWKDADRFKQAVVKSNAWTGDMNQNTDKIVAIINDTYQYKTDAVRTAAQVSDDAELGRKVRELVKE